MKLGTEQLAGAEEYAVYLQSPEGKIRTDLSWANLYGFLPPAVSEPCALDLGGGTGAISVRLAGLGFHVTLVDISEAMLAVAERTARELKLKDRILLQQADAAQLLSVCREHSQDLVVCHNLLEYLDDVPCVLDQIRRVLKPSSTACVSIVVRNRMGEVMKAAIKERRFRARGGESHSRTNARAAGWRICFPVQPIGASPRTFKGRAESGCRVGHSRLRRLSACAPSWGRSSLRASACLGTEVGCAAGVCRDRPLYAGACPSRRTTAYR